MSLALERRRPGRIPFQYVEIDLDFCANTYGLSPCRAELRVTGTDRCYNTRSTCQDPANYNRGVKTYRFCSNTADIPPGFSAFPFLVSVGITPAKLDIGKGLGERASCTVMLEDAPHHDRGIDPYVASRSYTPIEQGTFFGKLWARNPYYNDRPLRVYTGYLTQDGQGRIIFDPANFDVRLYFIQKVTGPDVKGRVNITAKDILRWVDDKKVQVPRASKGRILAVLTDSATSATLTPSGIGDEDYPASGFLRIDDEVLGFTRVADALTLTRGQFRTVAVEHDEDQAAQLCQHYNQLSVVEIVRDVLVNFAQVPEEYIPYTEWLAEDNTYISRLYSGLITTPTGANALIAELAEQVPFYIWWDERFSVIRFRSIRAEGGVTRNLSDVDGFLAESVSVKDMPEQRVSQVWVYFALRDPVKDLTRAESYGQLYIAVDTDSQGPNKYDASAVRRVFSRWINEFNRPAAQALADRVLARYSEVPKMLTFSADAKDGALWTGDYFKASSRMLQDVSGAATPVIYQVLAPQESNPGHLFSYEALEQKFVASAVGDGDRLIIIGTDTADFNLRTAHDSIYTAPMAGDVIRCIVDHGVVVSASTTGTPAFNVGDWPAGVELYLLNQGTIVGAGGQGALTVNVPQNTGNGASQGPAANSRGAGEPGSPGGIAFRTRLPIVVENVVGRMMGGGGGGGTSARIIAAQVSNNYRIWHSLNGGGGGGRQVGSGRTDGYGGISQSGTLESGGAGVGPKNSILYTPSSVKGGDGGAPGQPGQNGTSHTSTFDSGSFAGGLGGAAGPSIDGLTFVTFVGASGDLRGPTIN